MGRGAGEGALRAVGGGLEGARQREAAGGFQQDAPGVQRCQGTVE